MLTDYEAAIAMVAISVMTIPSAMPAPVMFVEAHAGALMSVAVVAMVAADIDADAGRVGEGRSADRKRRCRRKSVSELSHVFLLRFDTAPTTRANAGCRNRHETFLNRCSATLVTSVKLARRDREHATRLDQCRTETNFDGKVRISDVSVRLGQLRRQMKCSCVVALGAPYALFHRIDPVKAGIDVDLLDC